MDPLSQGTVGAAFAQSAANKKNIAKIGVVGFLAGLAPDLDVLFGRRPTRYYSLNITDNSRIPFSLFRWGR